MAQNGGRRWNRLSNEVECDEVDVVAGRERNQEAVAVKEARTPPTSEGGAGLGDAGEGEAVDLRHDSEGRCDRIRIQANVRKVTIAPLIKGTITPGSMVDTEITEETIRWTRKVVAIGLRKQGFRKKQIARVLNMHPNSITTMFADEDESFQNASRYRHRVDDRNERLIRLPLAGLQGQLRRVPNRRARPGHPRRALRLHPSDGPQGCLR